MPVDHRAGSSPNSSFVTVVRVVKHGHLEVICSGNTQHMPVQRATLGDSGVLFHAVRLGARSDYREVMLPMVLPCRKPPAAAEAMTRTVPDEGRSWWVSLTAWRSAAGQVHQPLKQLRGGHPSGLRLADFGTCHARLGGVTDPQSHSGR